MTAIVILNWNGWEDTIECLKSLYSMPSDDYCLLIADNASTNNSIEHIKQWLSDNNKRFSLISESDASISEIAPKQCVIYSLSDNYGFAKANNMAFSMLASVPCIDKFLCLNNDTVVQPDFLEKLLSFHSEHPYYKILTPQIRFFSSPSVVWNCGGEVRYGFRKYHYYHRPASEIKEKEYIRVSYITGCAMFFDKTMLSDGKLFTERFYFGEEDYELAMRLERLRTPMACVLNSIIYHKIGGSQKDHNSLEDNYINYLNRFVDVRGFCPKLLFPIWQSLHSAYILYSLRRNHSYSLTSTFRMLFSLNINCYKYDSVTKEMFRKYSSGQKIF